MIASSRAPLALLALSALGTAGCGVNDDDPAGRARTDSPEPKLEIATTVAPITSIVANVGGDRVKITGIVPEGTDAHTFEPQPSVAELLGEADVLYLNGLELEEPTRELGGKNSPDGAEIVELGTKSIPESEYVYDSSFPREDGKPNPHGWTDPGYVRKYAEVVRDDLSARDPQNASYYAGNYDKFAAMIDELDQAMRTSFNTIPREQRKLLTYHDAYPYFARDYGWDVIGAVQDSDSEDPTAKDVGQLIDQVEKEDVPAIFGSEVFPSPVLEQIGRETGVRYVDVLRDDDLPGGPGDPTHSWAGLMHFDFITMTEAMGGDASALQAFTPRDVAPDGAEYPQ